MKTLKVIITLFFIGFLLWACGVSPVKTKNQTKQKIVTIAKDSLQKENPVVIANDSLQYEIIIIDFGFNTYLNTIARPMGFYSQNYLELKNRFYVISWNYRARSPFQYDPNIYENIIDYDPNINYGMEVNYKLFNYFEFAQRKYKMRL